MTETHYVQWDARSKNHGRNVIAVCGASVPRELHADKPSCPECWNVIDDDDATDRALAEKPFDPSTAVKSEFHDTLIGYTPREGTR